MTKWLYRGDSSLPYQDWYPFPQEAIVQVRSYHYPNVPDTIDLVKDLWWGYEHELGDISEGVIASCRRLDKPK